MLNKMMVVAAALPFFLDSCFDNDGGGGPRATPVVPKPELSLRRTDECNCQGAQEIFAENRAGKPQEIAFTMLREQTNTNRSCVVDIKKELASRSSISFGCTVGEATDEILDACPTFSSSSALCSVTQVSQDLIIDDGKPPVSCLSACGVGTFNAELCTMINSAVSRPEYRTRVDRISALFSANTNEIPKPDFMALFDDEDDGGCNRQNILLGEANGQGERLFENFGDTGDEALECTIAGDSPNLQKMNVTIPSLLQGTFKPTAGSSQFSIKFSRAPASPRLDFENQIFNAIYGGNVREIHWQNNRVILGVGNTCLASNL